MMNFLIFLAFDFIPAVLVYSLTSLIVYLGYKKKKAQKQIKDMMNQKNK